MAPQLNFILASILLLGSQISAAPLNDRDNAALQRRNPEDGWGCQYEGPNNSGMNPSLDLPGMVAGLCRKVRCFLPLSSKSTIKQCLNVFLFFSWF